jgi:hypothetical protein
MTVLALLFVVRLLGRPRTLLYRLSRNEKGKNTPSFVHLSCAQISVRQDCG